MFTFIEMMTIILCDRPLLFYSYSDEYYGRNGNNGGLVSNDWTDLRWVFSIMVDTVNISEVF